MNYSDFHQVDPELEESRPAPVFHDLNGAPVYETPDNALLSWILHRNDVASLHLYNRNAQYKIFRRNQDEWYHPFVLAAGRDTLDALRALLEIYLADSTLTEPLETCLARLGVSPINAACAGANREMTLWLLHHNPPLGTLHTRDTKGETPLFSAAKALGHFTYRGDHGAILDRYENREEIARLEDFIYFLLDQNCSVRDLNVYANPQSTFEGLVQLQDWGKQKSDQVDAGLKDTVLCAAIPHASYQLVSRLITEGADIHAQLQSWYNPDGGIPYSERVTALHIASIFSNPEGIQALLDHHGNVKLEEMVSITDEAGRLALHWALKGDRDNRTEMCVKKDQEDMTSSLVRTVELLLNANPDTINIRDEEGSTVFHYVVSSHTGMATIIPLINLLFNAKTKPLPSILNACNHKGMTAMGEAINNQTKRLGTPNGQLMELLETLLRNGSDARVCDNAGQNLLHKLGSGFADTDLAEISIWDMLLEFIDVNEVDAEGRTPLHSLVRCWNRTNAVRHLISRGADVTMADHKGNVPLHLVMTGRLSGWLWDYDNVPTMTMDSEAPAKARGEMMQALMDAGASMDHVNAAGQTPSQLLDELKEREKKVWQREKARRAEFDD